jgi:hypothetical protein
MPIDATKGLSGVCPENVAPALTDRRQPRGVGLFLETDNLAASIEPEDAHRRGDVGWNRLRRDCDVGVAIDVGVDELGVVHAIELVAGEHQVVVGFVPGNMPRRLPDRVGRALVPVRVVGRLFGGENLDEALVEDVHPVRLSDMPVERRRVELREHEDPPHVGVQAVADRDVDQPVLAANRHGGFRALLCERKQPLALASAENDCQHFRVDCHESQLTTRTWQSQLNTRDNGGLTRGVPHEGCRTEPCGRPDGRGGPVGRGTWRSAGAPP